MPVAHCPHIAGAEAGRSSLSGGPCQRMGRPSSSERGPRSCAASGITPLSFPHPFLYRPAAAEEEASWQQQSPTLGSPPGSTARFSPRLSLLPGPWHQPAPRQVHLTGRLGRGHRLLSPTVALPPLPWALAVSQPLSSPHSCPPEPGRTVPQHPKGASLRPQGLGLLVQQNLPVQQGWAPTPAARGYRLPKSPCCTLACGRESEPGFQPRPIPTEGRLRKPRGSSSESLCRLPRAAPHPTDRLRPCPCHHPNLTPRAGAARFLPTRLAAARPRCLPCRWLVGLIPQGAFGGPLASSLGGLSPCHLWGKAGSLLSSSSSAPAVCPAQAKPALAVVPRRATTGAHLPRATATRAVGPFPARHRAMWVATSDLTMAALTSHWGSPGLSRAGRPCGLPWGNTAAALSGSGSP